MLASNMSELAPSFEQVFYQEAIRFNEEIATIQVDSLNEVHEKIREALKHHNDSCGYRGLSIKVWSMNHMVDLSHGEATQGRQCDRARGTVSGQFIGFAILPYENPLDGSSYLSLATVLDTTILEEDIEHDIQVFVVTPISGAEISLLTE
jgi:hypothetical protein